MSNLQEKVQDEHLPVTTSEEASGKQLFILSTENLEDTQTAIKVDQSLNIISKRNSCMHLYSYDFVSNISHFVGFKFRSFFTSYFLFVVVEISIVFNNTDIFFQNAIQFVNTE